LPPLAIVFHYYDTMPITATLSGILAIRRFSLLAGHYCVNSHIITIIAIDNNITAILIIAYLIGRDASSFRQPHSSIRHYFHSYASDCHIYATIHTPLLIAMPLILNIAITWLRYTLLANNDTICRLAGHLPQMIHWLAGWPHISCFIIGYWLPMPLIAAG